MSLLLAFAASMLVQDADKETLMKALDKSAGRGAMKLEGAVAPVLPEGQEQPPADERGRRGGRGGGFGGGFGGFEGMFTAVVTKGGDAKVTAEMEEAIFEIYKVGEKTAHRAVGSGTFPRGAGNLTQEIARILDFAAMVAQLDKATDFKTGELERIGDVDCRLYSCTIVPKNPEVKVEEGADQGAQMRAMFQNVGQSVRQIKARVWVDPAGGMVRKIAVELERGPTDAMVEQMRARFGGNGGGGGRPRPPQDGGNQDQPAPPDGGGQGRPGGRGGFFGFGQGGQVAYPKTAYEIEILAYLDDAKIDVPAELQKYLK